MSISQKKDGKLKVVIEKNEIKNKLQSGIRSKQENVVHTSVPKKNLNTNKIVRSSNKQGALKTTSKNKNSNINMNVEKNIHNSSNPSNPYSYTDKVINKNKDKNSNLENSNININSRIKTSKESISKENVLERKSKINTIRENETNLKNDKIKTSKENYLETGTLNRSKSYEEDNIEIKTINDAKRIISDAERTIHTLKNIPKVGRSIKNATLRTGRLVIRKDINGKLHFVKPTKEKIAKSLKKLPKNIVKATLYTGKETIKLSGNIIKNNVRTTLEDEKNDLAIKATMSTYENIHTMHEIGKRIINYSIKRRNEKQSKQNKIFTKKEKNIFTENSIKIHTKKDKLDKTINNKYIKGKEKQKNLKINQKKIQEKVVKIKNELQVVVKKMAAAAAKSKAAIIGLVIAGIVFMTSVLFAIAGGTEMSSICIPNIKDPDRWIQEITSLTASLNREIEEADIFRTCGSWEGADWRTLLAIYLAQYYNDPPENYENSNKPNKNTSGSKVTFSGSYSDLINAACNKYNVEANFIAAVIKCESDFNPNETSPVGAAGLMQIMPSNFSSLGITNGYDPYQNVMGGTKMLQELLEKYQGDKVMALMAYNCGEGTLRNLGIKSSNDLFKAPAETRAYVPKCLAAYNAYSNGTQIPDRDVTGTSSSGWDYSPVHIKGDHATIGELYRYFCELDSKTITRVNAQGEEEELTVVTLTKHNTRYVLGKVGLNSDQLDIMNAMLEANAFSEVLPNCGFGFRSGGYGGSIYNSDYDAGSAIIGGSGHNGSGEAASDSTFAQIQDHIEECLGTPYVMGGTTPGRALDCSGFVSYVFTQSGIINGRYTAQGLCDISSSVSEEDLKPGDLIFFQGTYDCGDTVTHVGIYVGDGMMAHSGKPCQYASFETSYWQDHLYGFGRLT